MGDLLESPGRFKSIKPYNYKKPPVTRTPLEKVSEKPIGFRIEEVPKEEGDQATTEKSVLLLALIKEPKILSFIERMYSLRNNNNILWFGEKAKEMDVFVQKKYNPDELLDFARRATESNIMIKPLLYSSIAKEIERRVLKEENA